MPNFIIQEYISLENARKDVDYGSKDPYNADNPDHYSEWAMAVAMQRFKIGQSVTEDELYNAIHLAKTQQVLDSLVECGIVRMTWDETLGEPAYFVRK